MNTLNLMKVIEFIRESHPDAKRMFTEGGCVGFAQALRQIIGSGLLLHDQVNGHVYFYWDGLLWDIEGAREPDQLDQFYDLTILNEQAAKKWNPNYRMGD